MGQLPDREVCVVTYAKIIRFVGGDPNSHTAYWDRKAGGLWEQVMLTKRDEYYDMLATEANIQICVNQATEEIEARPAGEYWGWGGRWALSPDKRIATCASQTLYLTESSAAVPPINPDLPIVQPLHLERRGNDFVDVQGRRIVLPGIDGFDDVYFRTQGRESELDGLMMESQAIGMRTRRIWCMGDAGENQVFSLYPQNIPNYFDQVRSLVAYENSFGIIPLFTCFVDAQRVMPDPAQRRTFWQRLNEALIGSGLYLISGGNQYPKNGFDPWADLTDPGHGVIWSRGSSTDDLQTAPKGAPASELHATRVGFDRALMDATASPPNMRSVSGSGMCWMTEEQPFGDANGYSEVQARQYGAGLAILWALAIHHNRQSQRGQRMTDETARTAVAMVKGMQYGMTDRLS